MSLVLLTPGDVDLETSMSASIATIARIRSATAFRLEHLGAGAEGSSGGPAAGEVALAIEMGCEASDVALTIHPWTFTGMPCARQPERSLRCLCLETRCA